MSSHAGLVRFDPIDANRTRVQLRMSYNPPGGALAHGVLYLLRADLTHRLDEDFVQMKTALEAGVGLGDAWSAMCACCSPQNSAHCPR